MKRDPELIRDILLAVEAHDGHGFMMIEFPGFSEEQIHYHIGLLVEAGFVHAAPYHGDGTTEWNPTALSWAGCEFLDAARDQKFWRQALAKTGKVASSVPMSVLQDLLVQLGKSALGIP